MLSVDSLFTAPWMNYLFWAVALLAALANFCWYRAVFLVRQHGERPLYIPVFRVFGQLYAIAQRETDPNQRARLLRLRFTFYILSAAFLLLGIVLLCAVIAVPDYRPRP